MSVHHNLAHDGHIVPEQRPGKAFVGLCVLLPQPMYSLSPSRVKILEKGDFLSREYSVIGTNITYTVYTVYTEVFLLK
jgi:hypothetical protein